MSGCTRLCRRAEPGLVKAGSLMLGDVMSTPPGRGNSTVNFGLSVGTEEGSTDGHSLTIPAFCAIVRQSTRTIAILYDSVL
jgi:hypothetical protein